MYKVLSLLSGLLLCLCLLSPTASGQTRGEIAFIGAGAGVPDIYLTSSDGSSLVNITRGRLSGISAFAWSPDGSQLVVSADRGSNLYTVSADGNNLRALTHNTGFAITQTPTWSPDGTKIAYVGNAEQNYDVFLINRDGSGVSRLTNTRGIYRDLAWSPDGTRIAYASGADFFNVHIFVMRADGTTTPVQVSTGGGSDTSPAWSPDGSRIAYQNDFQFGPPEVFAVNADGTGQTRLTNIFASDRHPTWSPDGTSIAFASNRDSVTSGGQSYAIYLMGADGSNPQRLPNQSLSAQSPAWRPVVNPAPPAGVPLLVTEQGTGRAVALDSVTMLRDPLPVYTDKNFSPDRHTRVLFFVGNLDPAALANGLVIEVRLTDALQRVFVLKPEGTRAVPGLDGVTQLSVRLPVELADGGDVQVSVTAGGVAGNSATMRIAPSAATP